MCMTDFTLESDEANAKERETKQMSEVASRRLMYKRVMESPDGRAVLRDILLRTHVFRTSFDGDALNMARREGERAVGLSLFSSLVDADAELAREVIFDVHRSAFNV